MRIKELNTGKCYDLSPGTKVEVERTNLFFNEWGEQSLPLELPDTPVNRELTGYPFRLANRAKPKADISCVMEHGAYSMHCRQAVLSARRGEGVTTSLYMNEGSFLSRIRNVTLSEVFEGVTVPGVTTVSQGLAFCASLMDNSNDDFAIFPVLVEIDGRRVLLNRIEPMNSSGDIVYDSTNYALYNTFTRQEKVDDDTISILPVGCYITPFVRVSYVLRRIFEYFDYTMEDSFLTATEPFASMVLLNNTVDSLLHGQILLDHLLPSCSVGSFLDVFRKKFCLEFIPDEVAKTVRVLLFKDMIAENPSADVTPWLVGYPSVTFQEERQLQLRSAKTVSESTSFEGVFKVAASYPEAWYSPNDGCYYRMGYSLSPVREMVADCTLPYFAGGDRPTYDVEVPDCQFCFSSFYEEAETTGALRLRYRRTSNPGSVYGLFPFLGNGRALNSTVVALAQSADEYTQDTVNSEGELPVILSFVWYDGNLSHGTNHDTGGWGYSLLYNGPQGIFETFWRDFDTLLRNSLHKVSASFLLPESVKMQQSVHSKVLLQGAEMLFDVFRYTVGDEREPADCDLLSVGLREPVSEASETSSSMSLPIRTWQVVTSDTEITQQEYEAAGYEFDYDAWVDDGCPRITQPLAAIYPLPPTAEQCSAGGTYHSRTTYRVSGSRSGVQFHRVIVSLTPVLSASLNSDLIWPPRQFERIR